MEAPLHSAAASASILDVYQKARKGWRKCLSCTESSKDTLEDVRLGTGATRHADINNFFVDLTSEDEISTELNTPIAIVTSGSL